MALSYGILVARIGVLTARVAYVTLDPAYPGLRLSYMIQDAQMSMVRTQTQLLDLLPKEGMNVICLDANWNPPGDEENPGSTVQPGNLMYMIYTSGSTGKPKGGMNIHRGVCNRLHWMQHA